MTTAIDIRGLSQDYGHRRAVDSMTLQVDAGQLFGFLGPNGAGKTTTIRVLLGMLRPTEGGARVLGYDCWIRSPKVKREIGYLPGDLRLYSWLTLGTALRIWGQVRGLDINNRGRELAERFQLADDLPVRQMSRGTRQKLGLVLALAHQPRLLILDEPTSGLDPLMQHELGNCLRDLTRAGRAVFFSSHTLSEVEQLCDRVAFVSRGQLIVNESLESLRDRARRQVEVTFSDASAASQSPPPWLQNVQREAARWRAEMQGDAQPLIRWAAEQSLHDLTVGPPELDAVFREYYDSSADRGTVG